MMDARQFLLLMCLVRISLMVFSIFWMTFRSTDDTRMRTVMLGICSIMLASNLVQAGVAVLVLKVTLW